MLVALAIIALIVGVYVIGIRDGARCREIELRVLMHQGKDIHEVLRGLPY